MDEAISKPLSVKAIQDVISKFIENKPEVIKKVEVIKPVVSSIDTTLLDIDMLESYVDIVGPKPVLDSIAMFEDMMPEYMEILNSNMVAKDQASIVSEAHKIKGAAGSIGLKRIQQVAQKAQSPDMPAWWDNISDWVDEINNEYQNDIEVLKSWLNQR
jgi:two-component system aerobic respiration control sensor histidine kinase ArcB